MSDPLHIKDDGSSVLTIQSVELHPIAGKNFMIQERKKPHRVIALLYGDLVLMDEQAPAQGWLWKCVKKAGWYGFRNVVSGSFLGHDGHNKIHAVMPHHKPHEYFMAERHEDGGYVLLTRHGEELWQVAISKDGKSLIEKKAEEGAGIAWDFVEVSQAPDL